MHTFEQTKFVHLIACVGLRRILEIRVRSPGTIPAAETNITIVLPNLTPCRRRCGQTKRRQRNKFVNRKQKIFLWFQHYLTICTQNSICLKVLAHKCFLSSRCEDTGEACTSLQRLQSKIEYVPSSKVNHTEPRCLECCQTKAVLSSGISGSPRTSRV